MTPESSDSNSSLDFVQFIGRALTSFVFFGEPFWSQAQVRLAIRILRRIKVDGG
jgi:hypothetical protein